MLNIGSGRKRGCCTIANVSNAITATIAILGIILHWVVWNGLTLSSFVFSFSMMAKCGPSFFLFIRRVRWSRILYRKVYSSLWSLWLLGRHNKLASDQDVV